MEVHHHAHVHHQSKWKEYIFQFLMLFLAVSLGFIVENMREHYIEKKRAKEYAILLLNDLVIDSAALHERTDFMELAIKKMDTMINVLNSDKKDSGFVERVYELSAFSYTGIFYAATTATMTQIKTSGNLRYFENQQLISDFSQYDRELENLKIIEDRNIFILEEVRKFMTQFLDLNSITLFRAQRIGYKVVNPDHTKNLKLYKTGKEDFHQYANLCTLKKLDLGNRINVQNRTMTTLRKLIISLKDTFGQ